MKLLSSMGKARKRSCGVSVQELRTQTKHGTLRTRTANVGTGDSCYSNDTFKLSSYSVHSYSIKIFNVKFILYMIKMNHKDSFLKTITFFFNEPQRLFYLFILV